MPQIHPTAVVDPGAELADDVVVHPYAIIGPGVALDAGCVVQSHSVIGGLTAIGKGCHIGPGAYVGLDPQHLGFLSRPDRPQTWLVIGDRVIIREGASIHRAVTPGPENATIIGDDCMLMGTSHVAHDCRLGRKVILANGVLLGGHVKVGDGAFIGGGAAIHQFVRVGRLAMVGGQEGPSREIPPFAAVRFGGLKGYNAVGCRRSGMSPEAIHSIRAAFHCIHTHPTTVSVVRAIRESVTQTPEVLEILDFIRAAKRGIQPSLRFLNYLNARDGE